MSPLDLCMAVLSLALLVGVSILFYISLDRRRFRAATSYMFLKHNRSRQAFLSICMSMIADFFANLFSYYGYTTVADTLFIAAYALILSGILMLCKIMRAK